MSPPPRLFGTDGIRGAFNEPPLDRDTVQRVAWEIGRRAVQDAAAVGGARVVVGGDTRDSTSELATWVVGALQAAGADAVWLGVIPTPGVAFAVRELEAAAGVVISASHNPHPDNGIKILDSSGFKLGVTVERELEARVAAGAKRELSPAVLSTVAEPIDRYAASLAAAAREGLGARPLEGLRIALDTGNGAATFLAPPLMAELGAVVPVQLGADPDGTNVNLGCGSTAPEELARQVVAAGCDVGFAFDGDADRVVMIDDTGAVRDGDEILFVWARDLLERGLLEPPEVVATTMSNLGLARALRGVGITLHRCDVGDREVVEALRTRGLMLGGESSGHVVHLGLSSTGDGLLTALSVARIVATGGRSVSDLLGGFERFPQVLRNVRVRHKPAFETLAPVERAARDIGQRLGDEGRLVLRYSGTEPLARIMIEGPDSDSVMAWSEELAAVIEREIGLGACE
ncbi:MAG TPA: phosphoglucosamine mutase [Thermoanaerobaculia bacterium]|nr:phosphoglucosamine mutase [Thermoanaerobaculia bacterium]